MRLRGVAGRLRRSNGTATSLTFAELVDEYLAQHDAQPETIEKLRWLLGKAVRPFGEFRLAELHPQEIAAWRMTIPAGHRFEATQALRQVFARAVAWQMLDLNPAKQGVDNPQRRRTEKRPFESWAQLAEVASQLASPAGAMVMFAAATGLRPGEWIALEWRDIDLQARVVSVRRAFRNGNVKCTKTEASVRGATAPGHCARSPRPASGRPGDGSRVPSAPRRLLRPPQLPQTRLAAGPAGSRGHAAAQGLRSPPHLRHLRRSPRRECLDRLLIVSRRQLEQVLRVYVRYYG